MKFENAFTMDTSSIKYGFGVTREVGYDMKALGAGRVMVVTDPNLSDSKTISITLEALRSQKINAILFDQVRIEPTDLSFKKAIENSAEDDQIKQFYNQFIGILKFLGAVPMQTKINDSFDYNQHEALTSIEKEDIEENRILDIIQEGWKFDKDVLRYAKVVISKKPKPPEPEPDVEAVAENEIETEAASTEDQENKEKIKRFYNGI